MPDVSMIVIAPYDPAWPEWFVAEAERINRALGQRALRRFYRSRLADLGYTHFPPGGFDLVYPLFKRPA